MRCVARKPAAGISGDAEWRCRWLGAQSVSGRQVLWPAPQEHSDNDTEDCCSLCRLSGSSHKPDDRYSNIHRCHIVTQKHSCSLRGRITALRVLPVRPSVRPSHTCFQLENNRHRTRNPAVGRIADRTASQVATCNVYARQPVVLSAY